MAVPLCLGSCTADSISPESPDSPGKDQVIKKKANCFVAFNIYVEDDNKSRSPFDANLDDANSFNKGMPFERALYRPAQPPVENETEENPSDINDDNVEDSATPNQLYHFAILFGADGNLYNPELLPLIWDNEEPNEEDDYATLYTKFYDNSIEELVSPYEKSFTGTVLVVVNASYDLEQQVKAKLAESGNLNAIQNLVVSNSSNNDERDNYLYLKDNNGEFILDEDGHRFLTMSSSMIIEGNTVKPAITGDFKFYSNEDEAKEHPTSLYVERLQAKYTVVFEGSDKLRYGNDGNLNATTSGKSYFLSASATSGEQTGDFIPARRLFIIPNDKEIKYVASYDPRSDAIGDRNEVKVRRTKDWKINIVGWDINGLEKSQYLFKHLTPNATYTSASWFESGISSVKKTRNFWAEDVNYNNADNSFYPDQYRQAYVVNPDWQRPVGGYTEGESAGTPWFSDDDVLSYGDGNPSLEYLSYKDLSKKEARRYVAENTFDVSLLDDSYDTKRQLRVGSHLIVTAQLLIGTDGEENFDNNNVYNNPNFDDDGLIYNYQNRVKPKYYMNDIFWEEKAYMNYVVEYLGYWMLTDENKKIFGNNDGIFYKNQNGAIADWSSFTIEEANIEGGDAMVWVKPSITLYAYDPDGEDDLDTPVDERYTPINPIDYQILCFQHTNYMAQRFNEGMMYYVKESVHKDPSANQAPTQPVIGDYGTVRNNWYYYSVESITSPGTPVSVMDQKIVPNNEPAEDSMGVSIRLMDWHREIVDVELEAQRPSKK